VNNSRKILIAVLAAVFVICAVSLFVVKNTKMDFQEALDYDSAEPLYNRAKTFIKEGERDKAAATLFVVMNKYPDSKYAERAIRQLIDVYTKDGDLEKTVYYRRRLLESFPEIKDAEKVKEGIEDLKMDMMMSPEIGEDSIEYTVQAGDTLSAIARRFNTTVELLKRINRLQSDVIRPGQKFKVVVSRFSIFVDKSDNILELSKDGDLFKTYTVSTGKDNSTPVGVFKIEEKMVKPVWYKVGAVVSPGSKEYELGERWMGLSAAGYGIHGTSDESTIGSQVTQGCVRMYNKDVVEIFDIVPSGTEVKIVD